MTRPPRQTGFFQDYTRDLKTDDLHRLFTRDTREAYHFFARHVDLRQFDGLPWYRRIPVQARVLFVAFTMRLSPARRAVYAFALVATFVGLINQIGSDRLADGTGWLLIAFALVNLLVLLEVADRLTLKNDLEVAREIQNAMLPGGTYRAPGVEVVGMTRPANTVGGDFYDIQPLRDGRVVIALGDVSGKGSPAALLMALLLAMFRTLVLSIEEENLEPSELAARLNVQVSRHTPGNRFITLFCGVFTPLSGELRYVSAGHTPPLILRAGGGTDRLADGGIALGMFARVHLPHRTGAPRTRRSRGRVQRRDHRGREPDRQAVRRARPRNCPAGRPVGRPGRPRKRGCPRCRTAHRRRPVRRRFHDPSASPIDLGSGLI